MLILLSDVDIKETGIYKITNPINGEIYIGSAANSFKKRFWNHRRLLISNKNPCKYLQRIYNKNPDVDFKFEILEICSKEKCIKKEQYYIDNLINYRDHTNCIVKRKILRNKSQNVFNYLI